MSSELDSVQQLANEIRRALKSKLQQEDVDEFISAKFYELRSVNKDWSNPKSRLKGIELGIARVAMDIIEVGFENLDLIYNSVWSAWKLIQQIIVVQNVDDPEEMKPLQAFSDIGGIELCVKELKHPEASQRPFQNHVLLILGWLCTNDNVSPKVIQCGLIKSELNSLNKGRN